MIGSSVDPFPLYLTGPVYKASVFLYLEIINPHGTQFTYKLDSFRALALICLNDGDTNPYRTSVRKNQCTAVGHETASAH